MAVNNEGFNLYSAMTDIDDTLITSVSDKYYKRDVHFTARKRVLIPVAAVLTVILSVSVYASIRHFVTLNREWNSSFDRGYEIIHDADLLSQASLSESARNIGSEIKRNFETFNEWESGFPGSYQMSFANLQEACDFLGLNFISAPEELAENNTVLTVCGDKEGNILNLALSLTGSKDQYPIQLSCHVFTDKSGGIDVDKISAATTEDLHFVYENYAQTSGNCAFIASAYDSDENCKFIDGYCVDGFCIYYIHLICSGKSSEQAREIMYSLIDYY